MNTQVIGLLLLAGLTVAGVLALFALRKKASGQDQSIESADSMPEVTAAVKLAPWDQGEWLNGRPAELVLEEIVIAEPKQRAKAKSKVSKKSKSKKSKSKSKKK